MVLAESAEETVSSFSFVVDRLVSAEGRGITGSGFLSGFFSGVFCAFFSTEVGTGGGGGIRSDLGVSGCFVEAGTSCIE
jgi:hypothetical protein